MNNAWSLLMLGLFAIIFSGCAFDIVHIDQEPIQYENAIFPKTDFELADEVDVRLGTGYSRKLNKGTKWCYVNTISKGDIFKTKDQILTIEGSNIFEAFIVVSEKQLVGFFLPVEETFSPLSKPITLPIAEINQ